MNSREVFEEEEKLLMFDHIIPTFISAHYFSFFFNLSLNYYILKSLKFCYILKRTGRLFFFLLKEERVDLVAYKMLQY